MHIKAFALPSIMIASVVMLMVLAAAISGVATTRTALTDQYYNQVAKEAAESGLAMADACIKGGTLTWPNPLRPGSDCNGAAAQCDNDASCFLLQEGNLRTTFYVDAPTNPGDTSTANAVGRVELTRTSNNAVWKAYTQEVNKVEQGTPRKLTWKEGSLSVGSSHACAIAADNMAYCWGNNYNGQLGDGTTTNSSRPVKVTTSGVLANKSFRAIAAGSGHTCAIASDNLAYCWGFGGGIWAGASPLGNNSSNNSSVPVAVTTSGVLNNKTIREIGSGTNFSCVIASDELPYCWGSGFSGSLGYGSTNGTTVPVAVTTSGALSGKKSMKLSVGDLTACVVASDYRAYCWGNNGSSGIMGTGSTSPSQYDVPVASATAGALSGKMIGSISTGGYLTCAVSSDNLPYCWGGNYSGQIGNNSTTSSPSPIALGSYGALSGKTVQMIDAGSNYYAHTCGIASDSKAYCWGSNSNGQLGDGSTTDRLVPVAVQQGVMPAGMTLSQIGAGDGFTCAMSSEGEVYCWGENWSGQLGNGTMSDSSLPVQVRGINDNAPRPTLKIIEAIGLHSCGLGSDLKAYCWGYGANGQLGDDQGGSTQYSPVSVVQGALPASGVFRQLTGSTQGTCGIASNDRAYCWGRNSAGGLGDGSTTSRFTPTAVAQGALPADRSIRQINGGDGHTCAIAFNERAYCWGNNNFGQVGDNTLTERLTPIAVLQGALPADRALRQITTGDHHTCAIASNNRGYCWGTNTSGSLGDGTTTRSGTPVAVIQGAMPAGALLQQIVAGSTYTCGIAADSKAYCWGYNSTGQLGDNTVTSRSSPTAVLQGAMPAGTTVKQIVAGSGHTCALGSNNQAYCWGDNSDGQLGDGTTTQRRTPVAVLQGAMPSGVTIQSLSAGDYHTCAIASDNKAYCWGYGGYGRLGDGSWVSRSSPVEVSTLPDYPPIEYRKLYY